MERPQSSDHMWLPAGTAERSSRGNLAFFKSETLGSRCRKDDRRERKESWMSCGDFFSFLSLWLCVSICAFFVYVFYLHFCFRACAALDPRLRTLYLLRSSSVALSISFYQCSLRANPMAVILRYIYVLRAKQRLAVTCVREVVALMEFYTWQPSRLHWYVFKILSRNKTCFCCLLGQVSGAGGAQGIAPGDGDIPKRRYIQQQDPCVS